MRINFHTTSGNGKDLQKFASRRCEFALDRFSKAVTSVQISLRDENGPRCGADLHCIIHVCLNGLPEVIVHKRADSAVSAISAAIECAACRTGRQIHRRTDRYRRVRVDYGFSPTGVSL